MTKLIVAPSNNDLQRLALVKQMVAKANGKIFTVTALRKAPKKNKETGELEHFMTMTVRTGVKKHLAGGKSTTAHKTDLISCFLVDKPDASGYRCFSGLNVLNIKISGNFMEFNREDILAMKDKTF